MINSGYDFSDSYHGKVIKVNEKTRDIAVYLPKLMHVISGTSEHKTKTATINSNINLDDNLNILDEITLKNCIWTKPYNYNQPLPSVGSDIGVLFFENDPKRPMWFPFNPKGTNGYYLKSEEYPELFDVNINDLVTKIDTGSELSVSLSNDFTVVKKEGNYNIGLNSEAITNIDKIEAIYSPETGNTFISLLDKDSIISSTVINEMSSLEELSAEDLDDTYFKIRKGESDYKVSLDSIIAYIVNKLAEQSQN